MNAERYFEVFVAGNFRAYWAAEEALTQAFKAGDCGTLELSRTAALRAGMNAAVAAHHFADAVLEDRPAWLQVNAADLSDLRRQIEAQCCFMLRTQTAASDLTVLGAVVDAYKHFELRSSSRPLKKLEATVVVATGWGELGWGEGKFGGVDQVVVHLSDGSKRALSSVLQNAVDAWRRAMGVPLEPFGQ